MTTLEGNTENKAPAVDKPKPDDTPKNAKGQEVRSHAYWAYTHGHLKRDASPQSILSAMQYAIAKQLSGWPNPDLDPNHKITKEEFVEAIKQAKTVSGAKPEPKDSSKGTP